MYSGIESMWEHRKEETSPMQVSQLEHDRFTDDGNPNYQLEIQECSPELQSEFKAGSVRVR